MRRRSDMVAPMTKPVAESEIISTWSSVAVEGSETRQSSIAIIAVSLRRMD
jgi:hypothetical protein